MKKLLDISSEERNRILEMHQKATRKNYLTEESTEKVLKIDSIKSAIYTTCNPQKQSTWSFFKRDYDKTLLKSVNLETIFKESSMGSKYGIQNGFVWEFTQRPDDGNSPGPSNNYDFYNLQDGGGFDRFATVNYGCSSNDWILTYRAPEYAMTDRANALPQWVWYSLMTPDSTVSGGKIPEEITIKLLNLIKSQPNINQNVFNAIKLATETGIKETNYFSEDMVKKVKDSAVYKALGGV